MKSAWALLVYVVLIFCSAAVLAPPVYQLLGGLFPWPFHRYVDRLLMLGALAWWPVFWRSFGLTSVRDVGVRWGGFGQRIGSGVLLGLAFSMVILVLMLGFHLREWVGWASLGFWPGMLVGFLALAVVEELLFRGLAQTVFIREWGVTAGVIATAILFMVLHFVKVPVDDQPNPVRWWSGWEAIGLSFTTLWSTGLATGYALVLLLLSGVLSLLRLMFRDLGLPIGLHTGLIVSKRFIDHGTQPTGSASFLNQSLDSHPLTAFLLLMVLCALIFQYHRHAKAV